MVGLELCASHCSCQCQKVRDRLCAGWTARKVFSQGVTYTYDDVILHPGFIDFGADEVLRSLSAALWSETSRAGTHC